MKQFRRKSVQLAIIIVVTLLAYSNIFGNEFLIDDHAFITNWEKVRSLSSIPDLLKGEVPSVHEGVYRPIRSVLYAVYYQLFGTNPFGWHVHSVVVHLAATVLVYFITSHVILRSVATKDLDSSPTSRRAQNDSGVIPFAAALLFGLHPIHTESITYLAASMEMTGVVFFFAAFYFYLRGIGGSRGIRDKVFSVFFALLAFFTYEMTLTLPPLIFLYGFLFQRRPSNKSNTSHWTNWSYALYFAAAALYVLVRVVLVGIGASRGNYLAYSFFHTQLTMLKVYVKYIQLLIAPYNVSYLHELAPGFFSWMTKYDKLESILKQSISDPDILFAITVIIIIIVIIIIAPIIARKRAPLVTFSISWFFISLLPVSYIVPQGIALGEKYLYIPSFGFILFLSYVILSVSEARYQTVPGEGSHGILRSPSTSSGFLRMTFWVILLLLTFLYGYFTFQRNRDWHDPVSFWGKAVSQQPKSPLAHYNVALAYGDKGNQKQSAFHYEKTIEIEPRFWEARYNLANLYLREGRVKDALAQYQIVSELEPSFLPAQQNIERIKQQ